LLVLFTKFTIQARVWITIDFAVNALFLPTDLGAASMLGPAHTTRAVIQFPAGIEPKIMTYGRQVQTLLGQLLDEL